MENIQPLITVLTPTWNRAAYLDRVWNGLNSQTYENIEWIVCNDGSTDDTVAKLLELSAKSTFPVTIITANIRIGKARMDNEAIQQAHGEFILWNDSDDYLLPQAIEHLVAAWNSIPETDRVNYVGVTALCANENGVISTKLPVVGQFDTTWNELREKFKVAGDMLNFTKSSVLKLHPFPEVDFVVPEGVVWISIGDAKVRIHPETLQIKQYKADHCISFSGKMEYCRGRVYTIAVMESHLKHYPKKLADKLWVLITFIRYSIHGELSLRQSIRLWGKHSSVFAFLMMMPFAYALAFKDILQGKVRKTHREFDAATKSVIIKVETN